MPARYLIISEPDHRGGAGDRVRGIMSALHARGCDVTRLELPQARWPHRRLRRTPWWFYVPGRSWLRSLRESAASADVVIGSRLPIAEAVRLGLGGQTAAPLVYDAHNDEIALWRQIGTQRQLRAVVAMEARVVSSAATVWVPGQQDAAALETRYPSAKVVEFSNGISPSSPITAPRPLAARAFTYGSWNYGPNAQGLLRLAAASNGPEGGFIVFGTVPPTLRQQIEQTLRRHRTTVEWSFGGFVETIQDMVDATQGPGIVAVWNGAGTKLRTVQLASLGVPIHITSEAASGLPPWFVDRLDPDDDPCALLRKALSPSEASWEHARHTAARVVSDFSWETIVHRALAHSGLPG